MKESKIDPRSPGKNSDLQASLEKSQIDLKTEAETYKTKQAELENSLEEMTTKQNELEATNQALETTVNTKGTELLASQDRETALSSELEKLKAEKEVEHQTHLQVQNEQMAKISELEGQIGAKTEEIIHFQAEKERLKKETDTSLLEAQGMHTEKIVELGQKRNEVERQKKEIETLKEKEKALLLEKRSSVHSSTFDELQNEKDGLQQESSTYKNSLEQQKKLNVELRDEFSKNQQLLEHKSELLDEQKIANNVAKNRFEETKALLEKTQKELGTVKSSIDLEWKPQVERLKNEINEQKQHAGIAAYQQKLSQNTVSLKRVARMAQGYLKKSVKQKQAHEDKLIKLKHEHVLAIMVAEKEDQTTIDEYRRKFLDPLMLPPETPSNLDNSLGNISAIAYEGSVINGSSPGNFNETPDSMEGRPLLIISISDIHFNCLRIVFAISNYGTHN